MTVSNTERKRRIRQIMEETGCGRSEAAAFVNGAVTGENPDLFAPKPQPARKRVKRKKRR